jgi:hypothetical protein
MRRAVLAAAMLVSAMLASACRVVVPGDGRLVAIEVAPDIADHEVQIFTGRHTSEAHRLGEYVAAGAHYWDAVGARLRTADEIGEEVPAVTVRIEVADAFTSAFSDGHPAWYGYTDGAVHVVLDGYFDQGFAPSYSSLFAHELGHALGLDHISGDAVMHPGESWRRLQAADVEQFHRLNPESFER